MLAIYGPLAVACLGIWLFTTGLKRRRRRLGRRMSRQPMVQIAGIAVFALGLVGAILGLNLQPYAPFSEGAAAAEVSVKALYPVAKTYAVSVRRLAGAKRTTSCILKGERWTMSGTRQQWHWWSLGPKDSYALLRLTGFEGDKVAAVCDIAVPRAKLDTYLPASFVQALVEATRANEQSLTMTAPAPLADGTQVTIHAGSGGLFVGPAQ